MEKKSLSVEKKDLINSNKPINKQKVPNKLSPNLDNKKNFARKFIEQQTTKEFIKKDNKPTGKANLNLRAQLIKEILN